MKWGRSWKKPDNCDLDKVSKYCLLLGQIKGISHESSFRIHSSLYGCRQCLGNCQYPIWPTQWFNRQMPEPWIAHCFMLLMNIARGDKDKAKRFQGEEALVGWRSQLYLFLIMLPLFLNGMEALGERCMNVEGFLVEGLWASSGV